jgi:hypothetical protein
MLAALEVGSRETDIIHANETSINMGFDAKKDEANAWLLAGPCHLTM